MHRIHARTIRRELRVDLRTAAQWTQVYRRTVLDLIAGSSEKLWGRGAGKIVEIDETASADASTIAACCTTQRVCLQVSSGSRAGPFLYLSPTVPLICCLSSSRHGSHLAPLSLVTAGWHMFVLVTSGSRTTQRLTASPSWVHVLFSHQYYRGNMEIHEGFCQCLQL